MAHFRFLFDNTLLTAIVDLALYHVVCVTDAQKTISPIIADVT